MPMPMPMVVVVVVVIVLVVVVFVVVIMAVVVFHNMVGLLVGLVAFGTVGAMSVVRSVATPSVVTAPPSLRHQQAKKQKDSKGQRQPHVEDNTNFNPERAASLPLEDESFSCQW